MKYPESEYEVLYKGTDRDMQCLGFQYEMGKEFVIDDEKSVEMCICGFHACDRPDFVHNFYDLYTNEENRLFKIKGHVIGRKADKVVCDSIMFIEELDLKEILEAFLAGDREHPYARYFIMAAPVCDIQSGLLAYKKLKSFYESWHTGRERPKKNKEKK